MNRKPLSEWVPVPRWVLDKIAGEVAAQLNLKAWEVEGPRLCWKEDLDELARLRALDAAAEDCTITDAMVDAALEEAGEWDGIDALSMREILKAVFALRVSTPIVPEPRNYYGDNDRDQYFADGWNACRAAMLAASPARVGEG